ncbi:hypothetical protein ACFVR1_06050 [Psychrobacillus sp. NPDC058041]|uniref:hypothetical protein n=1 Tax=Psychrobacillus sp. NPDC058041 TaxID=3346310 RepID=UPI0036D818C1
MSNKYENEHLTKPTRMIRSQSKSRIIFSGILVLLIVLFIRFLEWYTFLLAVLCIIVIIFLLKNQYNREQFFMDDIGFTFLNGEFEGKTIAWDQMSSITYESNEHNLGKRYDHFVISLEKTDSSSSKEYPFVISEEMDIGLVELFLRFNQNGIPTYQIDPATNTLEQIDFNLEDKEAFLEKGLKLELEIHQANEDEFNNFPFRPIWKPIVFLVNIILALLGLLLLILFGFVAYLLVFSHDKEFTKLNIVVRYVIALFSLYWGFYLFYMSWAHGMYSFFGVFLTNNLSDYRTRFGKYLYNRFSRIKI